MTTDELRTQLAEPFEPSELEWRGEPRGVNLKDLQSGAEIKVLVFAYVKARAIQNRLDEVVGINNWMDSYEPGPSGGVMCSLSIRIDGEWVTKQGIAANTQIEAEKGGESEALKRAAYKWGIGRYLYSLPDRWCKATVKGKGIILLERPSLPQWAFPHDWAGDVEPPNTVIPVLKPSEAVAQAYKNAPTGLVTPPKKEEQGKSPELKGDAQLEKARAYKVPTGHELPSEGKTFGELLDNQPFVAHHLLRVIAGRAQGAKPFVAKDKNDEKAVAAAIYILDRLPAEEKAAE